MLWFLPGIFCVILCNFVGCWVFVSIMLFRGQFWVSTVKTASVPGLRFLHFSHGDRRVGESRARASITPISRDFPRFPRSRPPRGVARLGDVYRLGYGSRFGVRRSPPRPRAYRSSSRRRAPTLSLDRSRREAGGISRRSRAIATRGLRGGGLRLPSPRPPYSRPGDSIGRA
jgi:hypothetical protein